MSDNNTTTNGLGFNGVLQIVFIVLKLCKVIDWSWWWVLAPTWIGIILVILLFIFLVWWEWRKENGKE